MLLRGLPRRDSLHSSVHRECQSPKPGSGQLVPDRFAVHDGVVLQAESITRPRAASTERALIHVIFIICVLPALSRWHGSRSLDSGPYSKRNILAGGKARLAHDHKSSYDSESHLRSHEPEPIDVTREQWIQQSRGSCRGALTTAPGR
jgi:hypothetical protein